MPEQQSPTSQAPRARCTTLALPSTSPGLGMQRCVTGPPNPIQSQPAGVRRAGLAECLVGSLPLGGQLPWGPHPTCVTHQETGLFLKRLELESLSSRPRLSVVLAAAPMPDSVHGECRAILSGQWWQVTIPEDPPPPPKTVLRSLELGKRAHTWGCSPKAEGTPGGGRLVKRATRDGVPAPLGNPHKASGQPGWSPLPWGRRHSGRARPGLNSSHGSHAGSRLLPSALWGPGSAPCTKSGVLVTPVIPTHGGSTATGSSHGQPLPGHAHTLLSPDAHQPPNPTPQASSCESSLGWAGVSASCSSPRRDLPQSNRKTS